MYAVLKEKGNNSNVILINKDTGASVILGKLTIEILDILEKEGHKFGDLDDELKLTERWELNISDDVGRALSTKAFKIHKPFRDQSKKSEQKKSNKTIDAMDVLLGLASYN